MNGSDVMTKLLINPLSINHINKLNNMNVDGYIIGLKNYSIFQTLKLDINEIKNINVNNKELYISINKPIHNNELDDIKNILIELSKMNITGVMYEDIAIFNINKNLNLNLNLILNTMHFVTNSDMCNYWSKRGVNGAYLSTELMISDFINIKKNTNMKIFINLYGHMPIFESSRTLISNYLEYIKKNKQEDLYYLYEKERDKYYPIYEEYNNTFILDDIVNGINSVNELVKNNIDYIVINSLLCDDDINNIIEEYIDALNGKEIKHNNAYTGFLYKESIFRVKE